MTGGSLGLRSGSYGSLDKQLQNGIPLVQSTRKPSKMVKEKDNWFHWIFKFAGRKKVGMLLLCVISAAVFGWVLYVGKGEDAQEGVRVQNINSNHTAIANYIETSQENGVESNKIVTKTGEIISKTALPPPAAYFLGYTLPQGHPCNSFTLPPPPADKKRTGPRPCPVCYLPVEEAIALMPKVPSYSPILQNLSYIYEENLNRETEFGGSEFGGYPTLAQRSDSYEIRESMNVHCGFVRGVKPGRNTGYDITDDDLLDMERCRGVVVASAIFGNFDDVNQPKNISDYAKENVCFFMFVDEETEAHMKKTSILESTKKIGAWRIVVVRNLPYTDPRRTGKIPKLLMHRMFPNARFSLWIDGKLELVVDPYQLLERFLWRKNATFAISRHYRRFDVFVEAEANKAAGKYDNASIDSQIEFYKKEGLTPYSRAKFPITSDVPEGCVIIREHVPISNLFACLWFNEVDRFTSRDQISFSTVRDKIHAETNWTVNMFFDCERRNFVNQKYHRDVLGSLGPPLPPTLPPPPSLPEPPPPSPLLIDAASTEGPTEKGGMPIRRGSQRRGRDRRASSRRNRKVVAGSN